jgi:hypothetical protein
MKSVRSKQYQEQPNGTGDNYGDGKGGRGDE